MNGDTASVEFSDSENTVAPTAINSHVGESIVVGNSVSSSSHSQTNSIPSLDPVTSAVEQAWELSLGDLSRDVNHHILSAYLTPLFLDKEASSADKIVVRGPSRLVCNYVTTTFGDRLSTLLKHHLRTTSLSVSFLPVEPTTVVRGDGGPVRRPATQFIVKRVRPVAASNSGSSLGGASPVAGQPFSRSSVQDISVSSNQSAVISAEASNINPRYTFSDFVVGNSNQFCHAAAMRVAENPGQSYNPLFIYGGVGLGKTHLLHAIGNAVLQRNPASSVLYMSSETFTNELIQALRNAKMDEFKKRLRAIEVLLIDDIQFISGKERTQEEFFHTFNALYSAKRQIVITSDKIPTDIPGIEERLQTRFSWGLTADLQAPDFETRVAIIKQKALLDNCALPENVAHLIAERISSNVRELEGALTRLHAVSSIQDIPISLEMAHAALKPLLQPKVVNVSVEDIKKAVANHFSLKVSDIISKRRTKNLSFPRHIAMYLCRKHTTASYPEIGDHFGGRDHSSVIHAASVVSSKIASDPEIKALVDEIERILLN
jgi:chromosomal replication initiator protein